MIAIFKRDFRALFTNVVGWLFVGVLCAFYGLYFCVYNIYGCYPNISKALMGISFILIIAAPILCMRVFTEERKNKTDQLIFTAPVSIFKIVLGKFLAVAATYSIVVLVIAISPIVISFYGDVSLAQNYIALLGFYLFGLSCIAICVFVSSISKNQIISVLISVAMLFVGFMIGSITDFIFSSENFFCKLLNCLDLTGPFQEFVNGSFDWTKLLYYLIVIVLFLVLTYFVIQKRRWTMTKNVLGRSISRTVAFVVVIVVAIAANMLLGLIPTTYTQVDVTKNSMFSITDETKDFMDDYGEDVTIYVLATENECDEYLKKTLEQFDKYDNIKLEYVDIYENPYFVSQYTNENVNANSLIVSSKNANKIVDYQTIYEYSYSQSGSYTLSGYDAEGLIVGALQNVSNVSDVGIYELTGHNENPLGSKFRVLLDKANYKSGKINLMTDEIPSDCKVLIINGPGVDLSVGDVDKINAYINNGGNVIASINCSNENEVISISDLPNYNNLISSMSVNVEKGLVFENDSDYYLDKAYALLPNVLENDITDGIEGKKSVLCVSSTPLDYLESTTQTIKPIFETSENAYVKREIQNSMSTEKSDNDDVGKQILGLEITRDNGSGFIVFGSAYMFNDDIDSYVYGHNSKLFINCIKMLTSTGDNSDDDVVAISSKSLEETPILVTGTVKVIYGILWGIIIPIAFIIVGIVIWVIRKKK